MNYLIITAVLIVALLIVLFVKEQREGWYPTTTYVNTPNNLGVYPMNNNNILWAYNGWDTYPFWNRYFNPVPFTSSLPAPPPAPISPYIPPSQIPPQPLAVPPTPGPDIWSPPAYPFTPMLTSLKGYKDYPLGEWVKSGMGYSEEGRYVDVYQLNLDPSRRFYKYMAVTDKGQQIPIQFNKNDGVLEDGDRFRIPGNPHHFTFQEADKFMFVYV